MYVNETQYNRVQFNNTAKYKLHNTQVVKGIPHTVNQNWV